MKHFKEGQIVVITGDVDGAWATTGRVGQIVELYGQSARVRVLQMENAFQNVPGWPEYDPRIALRIPFTMLKPSIRVVNPIFLKPTS